MNKLCVISGAQLEKQGGDYWGRFAFVDYLEEMTNYFRNVTFFTRVKSGRERYSTKLGSEISVKEILYRGKERGPSNLLGSVLRDQHNLWKLLDKTSAVLVFYPCSWAVSLLPVIWLKAGGYVAYFGNDPKEFVQTAQAGSRLGAAAKRTFYKGAQRLSVVGTSALLARGRSTYRQLQDYSKPVFTSQPIVGLTEQDVYERKDTCWDERVELLYVGGMYKRKGLKFLIDSLERILKSSEKDPAFRLRLVGEGEERGRLEEQVSDRGLEGSVKFEGYVDEKGKLLEIYRGADIFVLPSVSAEGFPRVIDEAMASGLPVVATDAGSISMELEDGEDALIVEAKDSEDLAKGILKVARDGNLRRKLIRNGKKRARYQLKPSAAKQHAELIFDLEPF